MQEALTNVAKHAAAKTVVVRLGYGETELSVQVDDDGRGGTALAGNGIRGMTERARADRTGRAVRIWPVIWRLRSFAT